MQEITLLKKGLELVPSLIFLSLKTFAKVIAQAIPVSVFCIYEKPNSDGTLLRIYL